MPLWRTPREDRSSRNARRLDVPSSSAVWLTLRTLLPDSCSRDTGHYCQTAAADTPDIAARQLQQRHRTLLPDSCSRHTGHCCQTAAAETPDIAARQLQQTHRTLLPDSCSRDTGHYCQTAAADTPDIAARQLQQRHRTLLPDSCSQHTGHYCQTAAADTPYITARQLQQTHRTLLPDSCSRHSGHYCQTALTNSSDATRMMYPAVDIEPDKFNRHSIPLMNPEPEPSYGRGILVCRRGILMRNSLNFQKSHRTSFPDVLKNGLVQILFDQKCVRFLCLS